MTTRELRMLLACSTSDTYKAIYTEYMQRCLKPLRELRGDKNNNITSESVKLFSDKELKLLLCADIPEPSRTLIRQEYFKRIK
jgi:hypothetical protein